MKQKNKYSLIDSVRHILALLNKLDFKGLLLTPTDNSLLQFLRYCFVGGTATIVDWIVLYIMESLGFHYLLAATASFICGLICNYSLSKRFVFNGTDAKVTPKKEFFAYAIIGVVGLLITLILMYIMTEWLRLFFMVSKITATILVLIWNFLGRKMLYK